MRYFTKLPLGTLLIILIHFSLLPAQEYAPPKTMDGVLIDWGRGIPYDPAGSHLYDNEAQILDNSSVYPGYTPPGEDPNAPGGGDNPLRVEVVAVAPMGNGFNIVSLLTSFDPAYKGGTFWVAIDLPGPSNLDLSEGFRNEWAYQNLMEDWYPLPFDSDCNRDRTHVDCPGSIVEHSMSDIKRECYTLELFVGGEGGKKYFNDEGRYAGPGFPIYVELEMFEVLYGNTLSTMAMVPGAYTLSGNSINLDSSGLNLFFHSNPHNADPDLNQYDVEVEINGIMDELFPLIDLTKVQYDPPGPPMTRLDLYKFYIGCLAYSMGDPSNEEGLTFSGVFPPPFPLYADTDILPLSGGMVNFWLNAGPGNGGRNYFLLGSVSGTIPGLPLPGGLVTLPLNWDMVTDQIIYLANSVILPGFHGQLDSGGQAFSQLNTQGPLPPAAANVVMSFSYLLYNPTYYPYDYVSNPLNVEIVP